MGVTKILAVARNPELLEEVRKLAPSRILVHSVQDGPIEPWAYQVTDGDGVDLVIDCLGDRKSTSALQSLMRISSAVFCLKKKKHTTHLPHNNTESIY